jgi:hypothetical protein
MEYSHLSLVSLLVLLVILTMRSTVVQRELLACTKATTRDHDASRTTIGTALQSLPWAFAFAAREVVRSFQRGGNDGGFEPSAGTQARSTLVRT